MLFRSPRVRLYFYAVNNRWRFWSQIERTAAISAQRFKIGSGIFGCRSVGPGVRAARRFATHEQNEEDKRDHRRGDDEECDGDRAASRDQPEQRADEPDNNANRGGNEPHDDSGQTAETPATDSAIERSVSEKL